VVRAQPPTSAYPGDEAILLADGTIEGFVGGQCAQNSVRKAALGVLQAGESVLLRVLPDGDVHFPEAPGACVVVNPCLSGGSLEIFLTPQLPAPLIRIYGATPIADALMQLCAVLGYDARRDTDLADTSAVVIASHGGPEAELIRTALDNGVGYIGLVASKVRGASILNELELSDVERARIHTPVGLPIGAKTPAEIAVSIAAELIAAVRDGSLIRPATPVNGGAREAVDPVCGMTVPIGPATDHLELGGADYWFCCPGCRTAFAAGKAGV
jgi:xanthine/CO dehydrogenase XdhC/CoxF family maturation factor/YHS domain-containing protein